MEVLNKKVLLIKNKNNFLSFISHSNFFKVTLKTYNFNEVLVCFYNYIPICCFNAHLKSFLSCN